MADIFGEETLFSDDFTEEEKAELFGSDANPAPTSDDMGQEENYILEEDECLFNNGDFSPEPVHPLTELQKLVESEIILNRQIAARNVLDTLCEIASDEDDLHTLVSLIFRLSGDPEFVVRVEIVAQVPQIAAFCREHPSDLESVIRQQLVPLTVKHLTDHQNQVRKTSQLSLLALLEKGLVDDRQLTEWICPLVIQLSGNSNEEIKAEAVTLMCKMAPLVGRNVTLKFFLEHVASFCVDPSFSIRQVCAMFFGNVCKVVGTEPTENILLQKFLSLCEDNVWGIRKNCAEVFMDVSGVVTRETRTEVLPNAFVSLLCDDSRWVRLAAYQSLGAVIATFADPSKTGLRYCGDGTVAVEIPLVKEPLVVEDVSEKETFTRTHKFWSSDATVPSSTSAHIVSGDTLSDKQTVKKSYPCDEEMHEEVAETVIGDSIAAPPQKQSRGEQSSPYTDLNDTAQRGVETEKYSRPRKDSSLDSPLTVVAKDGHLHLRVGNESDFNHFQFWRVPIPDVELDIDIKDGKATSIHIVAKVHDEKSDRICASDLSVKIAPKEEPCEESENVEGSKNSTISAEKLDIQTACMNTVSDENYMETGRTDGGRISVVNSSFTEASVVLKQGELSEVSKLHNRLLLEDCNTIFQSRYRLGLAEKPVMECDKSPYEQDIVPPQLLEYYIGMVDSIQSQTVDVDIAQLCARSFPAVVYTLGRKYWPCLKRLCDALSKDLQWKVRKTIAACLHDLGIMLGSEITAQDLLPVFVSFLKDLDEVRVGVLSNLPEFLKLLKPSERREFLPLTEVFVKLDNERNWRYRYVLAQQLGPITDLFSPSDVEDHFAPIGMWLITDKVSEVRLAAARMMAMVLRRLSQTPNSEKAVEFVIDISNKFRNSQKWQLRQMYALLCEQLALTRSFPHQVFVKEVVPTLLSLTWDAVPNVRIAVARCLAQTLIPLDYFPSIQKTHYQLLLQVMYALQSDADRDVRQYAHVTSAAFAVLPPDKQ